MADWEGLGWTSLDSKRVSKRVSWLSVKAAEKAAKAGMVTKDMAWEGDKFVEQSDKLVSNQDDD